ncbi:hypothetical protein BH10BAC3_BH10BAC3_32850 [soil metagenome]
MKTIIAPTDFTPISLNAVDYAADMAVDLHAKLLLVHVVELTATSVSEFPMTEVTYYQVSHELELEDLKNTIVTRTKNAIEVETQHLLGNVSYEVKEICKQLNPFAVVMGTHAPGMIERFLFGSTTLYTIMHLPFPVMIVPDNAVYKPIKKIGFATDLKGIYNVPLEELKTVTRAFDASLHVIHIALENEHNTESLTEKTLLQHRLKEFHPQFYYAKSDSVEKGIEQFTIGNNIDLMLLVPKKHGLFHKSQSKQVVFHIPVPAMTIHEE